MNALVKGGTPAKTMTSREIAELLESRHDSVKRTMDALEKKGVIRFTQSVETSHQGAGARPVDVYQVNKRDSLIIVAQICPEFTARIVDRWQELEDQAARPASTLPDFSNPAAAARAWADAFEKTQALAIERDHAIATKAQIGSKREATAMATASAAKREVLRLKDELGVNQRHATIIAVENALGIKFDGQFWRNLKRWCDQHGITAAKVVDPRWGEVKAWPAEAWKEVQGLDLTKIFPAPPGMSS